MNKYIPHIYIFLWLLYYQQDGTIVSRLSLVVLVLMSLYYLIYSTSHYKLPIPLKILSFMVLAWTFYGIIPIMEGSQYTAFYIEDTQASIQPFTELKAIYVSVLPIFAFFVYTKQGLLTEKFLQRWFIVFLAFAVYTFFVFSKNLILMYGRDDVINNAGYGVLSLLTLIPLFWRKPILQFVFLGVCMAFILMGFKRGAIIIGAICSVWIIYYSLRMERNDRMHSSFRRKLLRVLMIAVFIGVSVQAVEYMLSTSEFFNMRLARTLEGDSSGREDLYQAFYSYFMNESSAIKFLFGNGAYGTLRIAGNYAHNDWLEIAIDYGLFFLLVYATYWFFLFKMLFKGSRDSYTTMMLGIFVIIFFLKTFFSMSYNGISPYAACALGYALANYVPKGKKLSDTVIYKHPNIRLSKI